MQLLLLIAPVFIVSLTCFLIFGKRWGPVAVVASAALAGYILSLVSLGALEAYLFIGAMGFLPMLLVIWAGAAAGLRLRRYSTGSDVSGLQATGAGIGPQLQGLGHKRLVRLDAEDLARNGIGQTYRKLVPHLRAFVSRPLEVTELLTDQGLTNPDVFSEGMQHTTGSSTGGEAESRARAIYALFQSVNAQLTHSPVRLYAVGAANDLGALFLTPAQAESARKGLKRRMDWPYLPEAHAPWYGRFH